VVVAEFWLRRKICRTYSHECNTSGSVWVSFLRAAYEKVGVWTISSGHINIIKYWMLLSHPSFFLPSPLQLRLWLPEQSASILLYIHPRLIIWFLNNFVFMVWGCRPHAQPPTWRTRSWIVPLDLSCMGDPTSSYATAGIALRVSGALKPHHHNKAETPSVECYCHIFT
jgi:hypothetical protein